MRSFSVNPLAEKRPDGKPTSMPPKLGSVSLMVATSKDGRSPPAIAGAGACAKALGEISPARTAQTTTEDKARDTCFSLEKSMSSSLYGLTIFPQKFGL